MNRRHVVTRIVSSVSLASGVLLFALESAYSFSFGGSAAGILIDYIAAGLLGYAGFASLRRPPVGAPGLLFGAWSYALCDVYRAVWWRLAVPAGSRKEPESVLIGLLAAGALTVTMFLITFWLARPGPASRAS